MMPDLVLKLADNGSSSSSEDAGPNIELEDMEMDDSPAQSQATAVSSQLSNFCLQCSAGIRCMALVPCHHLVYCEECWAEMKVTSSVCPKSGCGKKVESALRIILDD